MKSQRLRELRIYRHRSRRENKWRRENPRFCTSPFPIHNADTSGMKRRARWIIAAERSAISAWETLHGIRLWRMEEGFAITLFKGALI